MATLLKVPALGDAAGRGRLATAVSEAVGRPFALREQDSAVQQLLGVFRFCAREEGGLALLAGALETVEPGCPQSAVVRRLADEWTAVTSLDGLPWIVDSWRLLGETLGALSLTYRMRRALLWAATEPRPTPPAPHAENPWHDFLYLVGQNTARGQLPPWMLHLDLCAEHLESAVKAEILAANRQVALSLDPGLAYLLDAERARNQQSPPAPAPRRRRYLAIRIEPDPLAGGLYTVSHSFLSERAEAYEEVWGPGEEQPQVPIDGLEEAVSRIVRQAARVGEAEEADDGRSGRLWLEFVLPFELLNLPVDWWPRDVGEVPHVPLAEHYDVVIRSLDRLQNRAWHQFWYERWQQLRTYEHPSRSVYVHEARGEGDPLDALDVRLEDKGLVALVLSEPPLPDRGHGRRELRAALSKGLPVVIWHRAGWSTREFREDLAELLKEGLQQFPAKVASSRREAAELDRRTAAELERHEATAPGRDDITEPDLDAPADHIGRHLTVLWDNPRRRPVVPDLPWPSAAGP